MVKRVLFVFVAAVLTIQAHAISSSAKQLMRSRTDGDLQAGHANVEASATAFQETKNDNEDLKVAESANVHHARIQSAQAAQQDTSDSLVEGPWYNPSQYTYMEFGGTKHEDKTSTGSWHDSYWHETHMWRPEAVKMKRCIGDHCEDCACEGSCDNCWYGIGLLGSGSLKINVPANSPYDSFVAEVWAECAADKHGRWHVKTNAHRTWHNEQGSEAITNAKISVYANGGEVATSYGTAHNDQVKTWTWSFAVTEDKKHVRVVFKPKDRSKPSTTSGIMVWASDPKDHVDDCMGQKMCLKVLSGDGALAGNRIRNSNSLQLHCIDNGNLDATAEDAAVKAKCLDWLGCLNGNGVSKGLLRDILEASVGASCASTDNGAADPWGDVCTDYAIYPHWCGNYDDSDFKSMEMCCACGGGHSAGATLAEVSASKQGRLTVPGEQSGECIHPSGDDPESWQCECGQVLSDRCQNAPVKSTCIREAMCESSKVCATWKTQMGCGALLLGTRSNATLDSNPEDNMPDESKGTDGDTLNESLLDKRSC